MNHGHVTPNPDGSKARCGGPGICDECSKELAAKVPGTRPKLIGNRTFNEQFVAEWIAHDLERTFGGGFNIVRERGTNVVLLSLGKGNDANRVRITIDELGPATT